MTRILFNITHGFQARMLLRTSIASQLIEAGCELIVVAPNANEPYFRAELDQPGFHLESMPDSNSMWEQKAVQMRVYFLMNPSLGATLNFKRERYRRTHPWRHRITRLGNLFLGNIPLLRRAYMGLEAWIWSGREMLPLLERHQPDLVVAGTPGFNILDAHMLRAARRAGIPTATVMLSWDNLTSKGYMGAQPDHLLVWSDLMRDEALRYHDYTRPIHEVGAAQFDVYDEVRDGAQVQAFRRDHGIPDDLRLVVWGTINNAIYPNQLDLLREYVAHLQREDAPPIYLWIRLHPQTVFGPYKHLLDEYQALGSERVKVELPRVQSEALLWDLPKSDMLHLATLMKAADVVVTPRSTLTIDAACTDTPVINLAIDEEFARGFNFTHYRNVVKHDGAWIVGSFDELCRAVQTYLLDPGLHREGRAAIVAEQQGRYFGRAGRRTAEVLGQLALGEPVVQ